MQAMSYIECGNLQDPTLQGKCKILKGSNQNYDQEGNLTHDVMFRKDSTTLVRRLFPINPFLKDKDELFLLYG